MIPSVVASVCRVLVAGVSSFLVRLLQFFCKMTSNFFCDCFTWAAGADNIQLVVQDLCLYLIDRVRRNCNLGHFDLNFSFRCLCSIFENFENQLFSIIIWRNQERLQDFVLVVGLRAQKTKLLRCRVPDNNLESLL